MAYLKLNTQGWLGGFATAQKAQQQFATKVVKTSTLVGIAAKGLKMFGFSTGGAAARLVGMGLKLGPIGVGLAGIAIGAYAAGKAIHKVTSDFVSFAKESAFVNATVQAFTKVGGVLRDWKKSVFEAIAPAATLIGETLLKAINSSGAAVAATGLTWNDLAKTALFAGNIISTSIEGIGASLEVNIALVRQFQAILAGNTKAMEAASVDLVGATTKALGSAMRIKGVMEGDLKLPNVGFSPPGGSPGGKAGVTKSLLERGSLAATQAISAAGGNPIGAVKDDTAKMLVQMQRTNSTLDKIARGGQLQPAAL